jgi:hypothetical protein
MHRIDGKNDEHVHNIVGVKIVVQAAGEPFFGYMHGTLKKLITYQCQLRLIK